MRRGRDISYDTYRSRVGSWRGSGFDDADVSSLPPIIPYSEFSPVRLEEEVPISHMQPSPSVVSHGLNVIPISTTVPQGLLHPSPCYSDYSALDSRYACFTPITQGALHRFCLDLATPGKPLPHQHSMWHSGQLSSFLRVTSPQRPFAQQRLCCPPPPIAPTASSASLGLSQCFHPRGLYTSSLPFKDHPDYPQDLPPFDCLSF